MGKKFLFCSVVFALFGVSQLSTNAAVTQKNVEIQPQTNKVENEILRLMNNERKSLHRKQMVRIAPAQLLTKQRTLEIACSYCHQRPNSRVRISRQGYLFKKRAFVFGENIDSYYVRYRRVPVNKRAAEQTKMNNELARGVYQEFKNNYGHHMQYINPKNIATGLHVRKASNSDKRYPEFHRYDIVQLFHKNTGGMKNFLNHIVYETIKLG